DLVAFRVILHKEHVGIAYVVAKAVAEAHPQNLSHFPGECRQCSCRFHGSETRMVKRDLFRGIVVQRGIKFYDVGVIRRKLVRRTVATDDNILWHQGLGTIAKTNSVHSPNLFPGPIFKYFDLGNWVNFPSRTSPACCTCSMRLVKKKVAVDANFGRRVLFGRCRIVSDITGELIKGVGRPRRYSLMKPRSDFGDYVFV